MALCLSECLSHYQDIYVTRFSDNLSIISILVLLRYNVGRKMVCKSLHPIPKGQEVTDNYGQVFYFKGKDDRQRELKARYWFECGCQACSADWPILGQNDKPKWRSKEDSGQLDFLESLYKVSSENQSN